MSALPEVVPTGPSQQMAVTRRPAELDTLEMIVNKLLSDPELSLERVERAYDLVERIKRRQAETEYNAAMADAQARLLPIVKNRRNDHTKSNYADLAVIVEASMPIIGESGFGITFSDHKSQEPHCLGVRAEVMHRGGFAKTYDFDIPIDGAGMKGAVNKTDTQAYGSTKQYGRRYAFCGIFNITTKERDNDGNRMPPSNGPISAEQIAELETLLTQTDSNVTIFLGTFASVNKIEPPASLAEIPDRLFLSAKGLLIQKRNTIAERMLKKPGAAA
jgi:hypothetical protein